MPSLRTYEKAAAERDALREAMQDVRERVSARIVVCEDECRREGGSDVGQAISEEALWLQALLVQIDAHSRSTHHPPSAASGSASSSTSSTTTHSPIDTGTAMARRR